VTVKTNGRIRELVTWHDLPDDVRPDFDYVHDEDRWADRFFRYRGSWYDIDEFERVDQPHLTESPFVGWDGFQSESYSSAVMVRYATEDECDRTYSRHDYGSLVVVGYYDGLTQ